MTARTMDPSPKLTMYSGVDFDDSEYGFKEEDKDNNKVIDLLKLSWT